MTKPSSRVWSAREIGLFLGFKDMRRCSSSLMLLILSVLNLQSQSSWSVPVSGFNPFTGHHPLQGEPFRRCQVCNSRAVIYTPALSKHQQSVRITDEEKE